jgi:hypothetical protein
MDSHPYIRRPRRGDSLGELVRFPLEPFRFFYGPFIPSTSAAFVQPALDIGPAKAKIFADFENRQRLTSGLGGSPDGNRTRNLHLERVTS